MHACCVLCCIAGLLKVGQLQAVHALSELPKTRHDTKAFVADVFTVPQSSGPALLSVALRGTFIEVATNNIRAFHRIFLLTPPTQDAAAKQWPALIVNDQLFIGDVIGQAPPNPLALMMGGGGSGGSGGSGGGGQLQLNLQMPSPQQQQQAMVSQLVSVTGIPPNDAGNILSQQNWNYDNALKMVQQIKQQQANQGMHHHHTTPDIDLVSFTRCTHSLIRRLFCFSSDRHRISLCNK